MNSKNILIIDDDEKYSQGMADILKAEGYTVYCAAEKSKAVELTAQAQPSLIIVKEILDDVSGFDIIKTIHKIELFKDIPVIMLTQLDKEYTGNYEAAYGIINFLKMPYDKEYLISEVKSVVSVESPFSTSDETVNVSELRKEADKIIGLTEKLNEFVGDQSINSSHKEKDRVADEEKSNLTDEESKQKEEEESDKIMFNEETKETVYSRLKEKKTAIIGLAVAAIVITILFLMYDKDDMLVIDEKANQDTSYTEDEKNQPTEVTRSLSDNISESEVVELVEKLNDSEKTRIEDTNNDVKKDINVKTKEEIQNFASVKDFKYSVQVGIFRKLSNAQRLQRGLKKKGYNAFLKETTFKNRRSYKVMVGQYSTKEKALQVKKRLEEAEKMDSFLVKI